MSLKPDPPKTEQASGPTAAKTGPPIGYVLDRTPPVSQSPESYPPRRQDVGVVTPEGEWVFGPGVRGRYSRYSRRANPHPG